MCIKAVIKCNLLPIFNAGEWIISFSSIEYLGIQDCYCMTERKSDGKRKAGVKRLPKNPFCTEMKSSE